MITQEQLTIAWNVFVEKIYQLRKKKYEALVYHDKKQSEKKMQHVYKKITDILEPW